MPGSAARTAKPARDLWGCFSRHFVGEVAQTDAQQRDGYRLRYRIYCEERRYEDPNRFSDGHEVDEYDSQAIQVLVRDRVTSSPVGVARLILPNWSAVYRRFPLEGVCGYPAFGRSFEDTARRRTDVAEISRFAVARSASSLGLYSKPHSREQEVARPPDRYASYSLVTLGLIALLYALSVDHSIKVWYALMAPALERRVARIGGNFRRIGPAVEHRGTRYPMTARVDDLRASVATSNPAFSALIDGVRDAVVAGDVRARSQQPSLHRLGVT